MHKLTACSITFAAMLAVAGCSTTGTGPDTGNYVLDSDSPMVGSWLIAGGSENDIPITADGRLLTINGEDGAYVVVDSSRAMLQSGQWGVDASSVRFTPIVVQGNVLWSGFDAFVATFQVEDNVLSLQGFDGLRNRLILIFERLEET